MSHPIEHIVAHLPGSRRAAHGYRAHCPVCDPDKRKSRALSVGENAAGSALVHCFRGCSAADVLGEIGLDMADLFPGGSRQSFASNGGPANWVSASAAADAVAEKAFHLLFLKRQCAGLEDAVFDLIDATTAFKNAARRAMRAASNSKKENQK